MTSISPGLGLRSSIQKVLKNRPTWDLHEAKNGMIFALRPQKAYAPPSVPTVSSATSTSQKRMAEFRRRRGSAATMFTRLPGVGLSSILGGNAPLGG